MPEFGHGVLCHRQTGEKRPGQAVEPSDGTCLRQSIMNREEGLRT
jgi:hypothetical protein